MNILTTHSQSLKKKKRGFGLRGEERGADPAENVNEREEEFE